MDLAVELGLLCNPAKTEPPSQRVKYCGFIYDTSSTPTLCIPEAKRSKALAMIAFVRSRIDSPMSVLSLAILAGTLESIADATAQRIGKTYLRRLYNDIHLTVREVEAVLEGHPAAKYYTKVALSSGTKNDLAWWSQALERGVSRVARAARVGMLHSTWGDGSGTGTGGTGESFFNGESVPNHCALTRVWMGTWTPQVHHYTSNWKELRTLLLTLEHEAAHNTGRLEGVTVFYFTDNMPTYHIVNKASAGNVELQKLLYKIKHLELQLNCHLVVIHVPGVSMIAQGTDGLSRGIWMSPLHEAIDSRALHVALFSAVSHTEGWRDYLASLTPQVTWPSQPLLLEWNDQWNKSLVLQSDFTVMFPPPEMAAQAITFFLDAWVESPLQRQAIFVIPRILQRSWTGISKHIKEICFVKEPNPSAPVSHRLPFFILHVKAHQRVLPPVPRLDRFALPKALRPFSAEAAELRGMS